MGTNRVKIAVLGGAFNPVTLAHKHVVDEVTKAMPDIHSVLVAPSFHHRFKPELENTFDLRMEMCQATFDEYTTRISDVERKAHQAGGDGSTRFLFEFLRTQFADIDFSLIIGWDNVAAVDTWKDPEWIKLNIPFIIVSRGGWLRGNVDDMLWYSLRPHRIITIPEVKLSSTDVREAIKRNDKEFIEKNISSGAAGIIVRNNLYA